MDQHERALQVLKTFPAGKLLQLLCGTLVVACSGYFLFASLGHYALWDDESMVGLVAQSVQQTGDTSVYLDHNLVAYRSGLLVRDGRDRSTPPLATYLAAASFSLFGQSAFSARLPFALFGLATIILLAWWTARGTLLVQCVWALGILGNVSLFLFCRQSRYYAASVFFSTAIVFLYVRWNQSRWVLWAISGLSILLFASSYLAYAALYGCLAVDYLLWRRAEHSLSLADAAILSLPQLAAIPWLASIWNPLGTAFGGYLAKNSVFDRLVLFLWNLRDLNNAEFCVGILVLAAPFVGWKLRKPVLLRMSLAFFLYVLFVSAVSPQLRSNTSVADIRYLVPLIPLGIGIGVMTILAVTEGFRWLSVPLALVAFQTNFLNGGPLQPWGSRYTGLQFVKEIAAPPDEPYALTADWIRKHVRKGESVVVFPDYMAYPLMFHAPDPVYGWQLQDPASFSRFPDAPAVQFFGREFPDYFIAFGPVVENLRAAMKKWDPEKASYDLAASIDFYWKDVYRPELFWRSFTPVVHYNKELEGIQIFKRRKKVNK